jgi:hypothetical protein
MQDSVLQIHVAEAQSQNLRLPHAHAQRHQEQSFQTMPPDGLDELAGLRLVVDLRPSADAARQPYLGGRVA